MIQIVNIVVSGSFNQVVNLQALTALGEYYTYNPIKYQGGYIKLSSARVTIYKSGKYIIPGIKSEDIIMNLWSELVSILSPYLDTTLFDIPTIKNIVAQDDFGSQLHLEKLHEILASEGAEYEPEIFSGLIWATEYGTANIFKSGKFVLLGCKNRSDLLKLDEYIIQRISNHLQKERVN